MTTAKLCGMSESRERQGGGDIVPVPLRSCQFGKSYDGLPMLLAASSMGKHAIIGLICTCTAGVHINNAPAKNRSSGEYLSSDEEKVGGERILRLRGGGRETGSSCNEDQGPPSATPKVTEDQVAQKEEAAKRNPLVEQYEPRPSTSGLQRSRCPIGTRSKSKGKSKLSRRPINRTESTTEPSDDASSDRSTQCPNNLSKPKTDKHERRGYQARSQTRVPEGTDSSDDYETGTYLPKVLKRDEGPWSLSSLSLSERETLGTQKEGGGGSFPAKGKVGGKETYLAKTQTGKKDKSGRLPTFGDYLARAETQRAYNDEVERETRLDQGSRTYNMADTLKILKRSHLDSQDTAEEAALFPTADIESQIREAQAEVVRVSKVSSNLKETFKGALRVAASLTMGMTDCFVQGRTKEALRPRARKCAY